MMEIDEPEEFGWGSIRNRFSFGGGRNYAIEDLENSIWKLLEWADSLRLQKTVQTEHKEKAIRVWLQPLVSASNHNISLFHNDFKKRVGRISQQEVESLLYLERVLQKKRAPGSDDADRCLQLLSSLHQKAPTNYRRLLVRWVVMEFSKKHPPSRFSKRLSMNSKRKKRNLQHFSSNSNLPINSKKLLAKSVNVKNTGFKDFSTITKQSPKMSKLMVGNVKENKKFPPMGWIFPCVLCFQPTSNVVKESVSFNSVVGVHICKSCYASNGSIPQDIKMGTRSNTRVLKL